MFKNLTGFPAANGSLWGDPMNNALGALSSHMGLNVISEVFPFDFDGGYGVDGDVQLSLLTGVYACKNNGVWVLYSARAGVIAYRASPAKLYANTGSAWVEAVAGGGIGDTIYTADGTIADARTVAYTNNLDFIANATAPAPKPNFRVTQYYADGAYLDSFVIDGSDGYGGLNFYHKSDASTLGVDTVGMESFTNIYDGQIGFNFGIRRPISGQGSSNIEFDTVNPTYGSKLHATATNTGGLVSELLLSAASGVFLSANNGTISTDIRINQYGQLIVSSTEAAFAGIEYNTDYSANFSSNSLINLGYADATYLKIADATSTPAGSVSAFAGSVAPAGWLFCDGSDIDRTTYAALFAAIGTDYGAGDGSTTFNVPDLRGEFVRGLDAGRGVDTGRVLGSFQADELKSHTHSYTETTQATDTLSGGDTHYIDAASGTTGATGGTETRPRNIAMNYMIKA